MQVILFHLMPYADLDLQKSSAYDTVWMKLPNALFDPVKGHQLYNRFLDELEYGEVLGWDGVGVNEHHQTAYGIMPTFSHDRFHEAHDLIVRAWTEPGPFAFQGHHYNVSYVNLWPRPFQRPHPPIWIPSQGSKETIDWASHPDRRYTYLQTFSPAAAVAKYLNLYRDTARKSGYEAGDHQLGWAVPVYVGDTDESALAEALRHVAPTRCARCSRPTGATCALATSSPCASSERCPPTSHAPTWSALPARSCPR